ncbi:MAG: STAS domain-containing protein [Acidobacteriota bacterium]
MNGLNITRQQDVEPQTDVLHLEGRATYREASELRLHLFRAIEARGNTRESRLVLELAEVETMDTSAMAVLVEGLLETRHRGPHVSFCTPSPSVRKVFELSGLNEALERCYGCLGDALGAPAVTADACEPCGTASAER